MVANFFVLWIEMSTLICGTFCIKCFLHLINFSGGGLILAKCLKQPLARSVIQSSAQVPTPAVTRIMFGKKVKVCVEPRAPSGLTSSCHSKVSCQRIQRNVPVQDSNQDHSIWSQVH